MPALLIVSRKLTMWSFLCDTDDTQHVQAFSPQFFLGIVLPLAVWVPKHLCIKFSTVWYSTEISFMLVPVYWRGVVCIWVLCSVVGRTIWIWFVDQLSHSPRLQALLRLRWVTQFFSITLENTRSPPSAMKLVFGWWFLPPELLMNPYLRVLLSFACTLWKSV